MAHTLVIVLLSLSIARLFGEDRMSNATPYYFLLGRRGAMVGSDTGGAVAFCSAHGEPNALSEPASGVDASSNCGLCVCGNAGEAGQAFEIASGEAPWAEQVDNLASAMYNIAISRSPPPIPSHTNLGHQ